MHLEKIRRQLEAQLTELASRVKRIEQGFQHGRSADSEDRSQEDSGNEVRNALEEKDLREIEQIRVALLRIAKGNYGVCSACSEKIDAKRLEAIPVTTTCAACASTT